MEDEESMNENDDNALLEEEEEDLFEVAIMDFSSDGMS
jgi:hypothetical protein